MKATAVLREPELTAFRSALAAYSGDAARLSVFSTDLEAVQSVYITGMPEIMAVDLDLPGVIGLETVAALKKQPGFERLPIVLVSTEDHRVDAYNAGASLCLLRPVSVGSFLEALRTFCGRRGEETAAPPSPMRVPEEFDGPEARKASRKPLQAACIISTLGQKYKGLIRDISLTGAKVHLDGKLNINDLITLIIGIPGTVPLKIVEFKARVVRSTDGGYGVAFRQMDPDTRTFVAAYTQKD
ncbi:MAG: PilZ domain-containing protein [Acidobacteriota bacterium]